MSSPASMPAAVAVCEPHGSSTEATRSGLLRSVISKTCTPSQPAGTVVARPWSSQVRLAAFGEFQDLTKRLPQTTMSPWSPLHFGWASSTGLIDVSPAIDEDAGDEPERQRHADDVETPP